MKLNFLIPLAVLLFFSCTPAKNEKVSTANGATFDKAHFDEFFTSLADSLKMPGMSVAIINDTKIAYHEVFGVKVMDTEAQIAKETYFEAASLSKPLFAFFVMKQIDKGILELDKPLYEYLPYPDIAYDERYKQITTRMVLSHTSGFPNWRNNDSLKIEFNPGSKYQYSGEGYHYLANVLAKVNNIPIEKLDSLFQDEIAAPLAASKLYFRWNEEIANDKATGHMNDKPTDNLNVRENLQFGAAGGLHTEAENYAKFLIAMMKKKVLSPESYTEIWKAQVKLPADDINAIVMNASGWSLGFGMIPTESDMCYWHSGNNGDFQSWFHFFPEKKYGIVLFTNSDKIQTPDFFTRFFSFLNDGIVFDMSKLE